MGIPQTEAQHKELLDIIMQSCQRREDIPLEDGTVQKNLVTDPKTVWYKSLHVASSKLGRFVFELETFSNLAAQAPHHMSKEKAKAFSDQILNQVHTHFLPIFFSIFYLLVLFYYLLWLVQL